MGYRWKPCTDKYSIILASRNSLHDVYTLERTNCWRGRQPQINARIILHPLPSDLEITVGSADDAYFIKLGKHIPPSERHLYAADYAKSLRRYGIKPQHLLDSEFTFVHQEKREEFTKLLTQFCTWLNCASSNL